MGVEVLDILWERFATRKKMPLQNAEVEAVWEPDLITPKALANWSSGFPTLGLHKDEEVLTPKVLANWRA